MLELTIATTWLRARAGALQMRRRSGSLERHRDDLGASIVETVVIIGLFVAAAIIIVGILVAKATDAANNVKTQ